ncbi:MAG: prephenate dehydrogenase/arogenate dehydrogenase family protein, partial [Pseudomonadota bacterium]
MTSDGPIYRRAAIIGLGLIGGSFALAARQAGAVGEVVGHARSAATRARALELGLVDRVAETAAEAAEGADLVLLCVPVGAMSAVAAEIAPVLAPGATVSDAGSVKRSVIDAAGPHLPDHVHFIPGHPLAGTEHSGPDAAFATLYAGRWCILTPVEGADAQAVARLRGAWEACGADVDVMDPDHHDLVLAVTSHAPHLIAYTMVGVA